MLLQNGASYCTTELAVMKNKEIHTWDRGFDDDGNQVSSIANSALFSSKFIEMGLWNGYLQVDIYLREKDLTLYIFVSDCAGLGAKGRTL